MPCSHSKSKFSEPCCKHPLKHVALAANLRLLPPSIPLGWPCPPRPLDTRRHLASLRCLCPRLCVFASVRLTMHCHPPDRLSPLSLSSPRPTMHSLSVPVDRCAAWMPRIEPTDHLINTPPCSSHAQVAVSFVSAALYILSSLCAYASAFRASSPSPSCFFSHPTVPCRPRFAARVLSSMNPFVYNWLLYPACSLLDLLSLSLPPLLSPACLSF